MNGCIEPRRPLPVTAQKHCRGGPDQGVAPGCRQRNVCWSQNLRISHRAAAFNTTNAFACVAPRWNEPCPRSARNLQAHCTCISPAMCRPSQVGDLLGPFGHSHCKSPQSSRKPHGGMNRDVGPKSVSSQIPQLCRTARVWDPGNRIPPPSVAPTAHPQTSLG